MDGANDGSSSEGQGLHDRHDLEAAGTVQPAGKDTVDGVIKQVEEPEINLDNILISWLNLYRFTAALHGG